MKMSTFVPSRRSGQARTVKQASNCPTIDRWCSPLKPIERGEPVVVSGGRIGAVIEKNLDGVHERRVRTVFDEHRDYRHVLARHRFANRAGTAEQRLIGLRDA